MGDIILTSPVLRNVKNQLDSEIHFLTKSPFKDLVAFSPHISKTHVLRSSLSDSISSLQSENYDLILDLQKNRKSKLICKKLAIKSITFDKLNIQKWILVQSGIDLLPNIHLVDRYFDSLSCLNILNDELGNELFIPNVTGEFINKLNLPHKYLAIGIGAQHKGKCLNEEQLNHIVNHATMPVVLLGGKRELDLSEAIVKNCSKKVWNFTSACSIIETAEIVRNSHIMLSGDTGIMHIASAFKVPQVSVWGCTIPDLGMYPYKAHKDSIIIEPLDHGKRPCAKLGDKCKYAPKWCIQSIQPERIVSALSLILEKQSF